MATLQATKPSLQLDSHTLSFLGLSQQPFAASVLAADAIYTDATRDQMMATLRHHMQFSDLVLIVEGEQGSGKTTLFRQLIQNNIPNLFLISILAEATDTLVQLQQKMSAHLKSQGSASYLDQDLKNLQVFDQFPIAIIDDAHLLSDTTLQELIRYRSQLKRDKDTNLKILLLANPGMAKTIEDITDLQHSQLYVQQMPGLSPKQVQTFIEHRLARAGYRGGPVLPPETIQLIYKKSMGKPGQIMEFAVLMLEKHVRNLNRPGGNLMVKILGIGGVLLLVAGGTYFWLDQTSTPHTAITPAPAPVIASESTITEDLAVPAETGSTDLLQENMADDTRAQSIENTSIDLTALAEIPPEPAPQPKDFSTSGIAPPASIAPAEPGSIANKAIAKPETGTPPAAAIPAPAIVPAAHLKPAISPAAKPDNAENQRVLTELAAMGIKDSEWLRQQAPANWTLQILGARDTTTLLKFAREHKLGDDSAWYETKLNGKPWFVMVHRIYTDADIARKGLDSLSPDLQRSQPWVKSLSAIQKDLAK
jgi:DamX protein